MSINKICTPKTYQWDFFNIRPTVFVFQGDPETSKSKWTKVLLLAGFATTVGLSLPVGYNIGVVNNPADVSTKLQLHQQRLRLNVITLLKLWLWETFR